ncbi:2-phospho-L-lactate transferase [Roseixanthobacter glucoisosaccharinicivorans]|uniref:2-phospho-L-lactate transferase n=1 Tax=Roseixanthobacter glucoisosaccharinicivorans TaxID=3119923 RepID=UPI00372BE563
MNASLPPPRSGSIVALCGGVGGAKLALGLEREFGARVSLVVNTGDDFEHLGLAISPDLDSVLYKLSGLSDEVRGWGRADESWNFMAALGEMGAETWFQLGDRDLALHVERTRRLRGGESLTQVTLSLCARLGIAARLLPMSDAPVRTLVHTDEGTLPFQRYFVERRCAPAVTGFTFEGAGVAQPTSEVLAALAAPDLRAVVICPSNPYLSIDPILAIPGLRAALAAVRAPVVAVSPIIGGQAIKGPTAKIMAELKVPATSAAIAAHYDTLIDGLVIDTADGDERARISTPVAAVPTLMKTADDSARLARDVLRFADALASAGAVIHAEREAVGP